MRERVQREPPVVARPLIAERHRHRGDRRAVQRDDEHERGEAQDDDVEGRRFAA